MSEYNLLDDAPADNAAASVSSLSFIAPPPPPESPSASSVSSSSSSSSDSFILPSQPAPLNPLAGYRAREAPTTASPLSLVTEVVPVEYPGSAAPPTEMEGRGTASGEVVSLEGVAVGRGEAECVVGIPLLVGGGVGMADGTVVGFDEEQPAAGMQLGQDETSLLLLRHYCLLLAYKARRATVIDMLLAISLIPFNMNFIPPLLLLPLLACHGTATHCPAYVLPHLLFLPIMAYLRVQAALNDPLIILIILHVVAGAIHIFTTAAVVKYLYYLRCRWPEI